MRKNIKHFVILTALAAGTVHVVNRFIDASAELKNILKSESGNEFNWKNGKVFYTKHGKGSPLLLIHDLTPHSSSYEWSKIIKKLEKNHTVYTIDLLGCGRSDKPFLTYTSYLYVQLITDFINQVIGEKTDVIATGDSTGFAILASNMTKDIIGKIIAINPPSVNSFEIPHDKAAALKKALLEIPIVGTLIYNVKVSNSYLTRYFSDEYYYKPQLVPTKLMDAYYESAHMKGSSGKYLQASIEGSYTKNSIKHALEGMASPLYIIQSRYGCNFVSRVDSYTHINNNIEVTYISNAKKLAHLEVPDKVYNIIKMFLED